MIHKWTRQIVWIFVFMAFGCGKSKESVESTQVWLSPLASNEISAEPVASSDGRTTISNSEYRQIIEGFRRNAEILLKRDDIENRLPSIETVFIRNNRYLELLNIYQKFVQRIGLIGPAPQRLAWGYIRLGSRLRARKLIDKLRSEDADKPVVWFLEGAYWLEAPSRTIETAAKVAVAWKKLLDLNPEFSGFGRLNGSRIKSQLQRIEDQLTPKNLEKATASLEIASPIEQKDAAKAKRGASREASNQQAKSLKKTAKKTADKGTPRDNEPEAASVKMTLAKGQIALAEGRLEEAERLFGEITERAPDHARAEFELLKTRWLMDKNREDVHRRLEQFVRRRGLEEALSEDVEQFIRTKLGSEALPKGLR